MRVASTMLGKLRRLMRRLGRLAATHREMRMLLRADERMLRDVGLTRGDAQAVAHCHRIAKAAAARRNAAMAAAKQRQGRTRSDAASCLSRVA